MLDLERTVECKICRFINNLRYYIVYVPALNLGIKYEFEKKDYHCYLILHIRRKYPSHKIKSLNSIPNYFLSSKNLDFFGQTIYLQDDQVQNLKGGTWFNKEIKLSYLLPIIKGWYMSTLFMPILEFKDDYWKQ